MDDEFTHIVSLLQREFIFRGLEADQIAWIAYRFQKRSLDNGTVVFSEGSPADSFFFILDGSVRVTRKTRDGERLVNILGAGNFFGESALVSRRLREFTVTTVGQTVLLRLYQDQFDILLQYFPQIRTNLALTAESRSIASRTKFRWLEPDEVIYFLTRKHDFFLYRSLIPPILSVIASIPILVLAFMLPLTPFTTTLLKIIGGFMLIGGLALGIWNGLDWGNDYYIVTNRRVIWIEKVIGLYDSRREAPLDTILTVNVISSQLGRILDYGNINVRTFTGGIFMRNAAKPKLFASFVEGYKKRFAEISKETNARKMEQVLEQALLKSLTPVEIKPPDPNAPPPVHSPKSEQQKKKKSGLREKLETFLKVRYEENGVITYRKHWFLLVQKAWLPVLGVTVLIIGSGFLVWLHFVKNVDWVTALPFFSLGTLVIMAIILGLIYNYWDWSNDIYQVTKDQILDIERKPLGEEIKKSANLESILSIEHERENLLGILFDFGTVTINVGQTKFLFYGVYNPDQVHQDIADRREALNQRKREKEEKREQDRIVNWLVTFHQQSEKLEEIEKNANPDEFSG